MTFQVEKCDYWWFWLDEAELIPRWVVARSTGITEWPKYGIFAEVIGDNFFFNRKEVINFIKENELPYLSFRKVRAFLLNLELQPAHDLLRMIEDAIRIRSQCNDLQKYNRLVQVSRLLAGVL